MLQILLIALILIFSLFALSHLNIMNNNKNEDGYNIHNSTLGVQCNAKEKCDFRYTTMCDNCKHNCGMKKYKSSFVSK